MLKKPICFCFGLNLYSASDFYSIAVKQPVQELDSEALSGRNSLIRQQGNAGSLANFIPSSDFKVSEEGEASPKIENEHVKKEETLKDDRVRLIEREAEVLPICECLQVSIKNKTKQNKNKQTKKYCA